MRNSSLLQMRNLQVGFELEAVVHVTECLNLFQSQRQTSIILSKQLAALDIDPERERFVAMRCNALANLMNATNQQIDRLLRMAGIPMPARGKGGKAMSHAVPILDMPPEQDADQPVPPVPRACDVNPPLTSDAIPV